MIRFAICDDEPIALDMLQDALEGAFRGQEIAIDRFASGAQLRAAILEGRDYDVVLLDINMPEINGIFLARHIKPLMGEALLIFVSSQEDAVFDAFSAEPFRFLRKGKLEAEMPQLARDILVKLQSKRDDSLTLRYRKSFVRVNPYRVLYIESKGKAQEIHLPDQVVEVNYRMKELEPLFEPFGFLKPHNSYLVNCRFISSIRPAELIMDGGLSLPVSKHRLKEVKEQYLSFISER